MIRLTKQADYAIVLLIRMVEGGRAVSHSAKDLARDVHLPSPIASKILKAMARRGLLASQRGVNGGYTLAIDPERLTVAEVIRAVEGPIALTECLSEVRTPCQLHETCSSRAKWNRINDLILRSLEAITLAEMARPLTDEEHLIHITVPPRTDADLPRGAAAPVAG